MSNQQNDTYEEVMEEAKSEVKAEEVNEVMSSNGVTYKDTSSLPEAPASITVKGYYKGFSVMITKRNGEGKAEIDKIIQAIDNMITKGFKPSWNEDTNGKTLPKEEKKATETFICSQCGGPAEYREGMSKHTNKEWHAIFCKTNKEHVKWI